jgi:hypothetical protein
MARNSKAIVTLAVGGSFAARWHAVCEPLWRRYCDRHGYDLICIEEPLDVSARARSRSPAWQKCLILGQSFARNYEQVVWVDADILPNPDAPSILDGVPVELVGAVDEYSVPTREIHAPTLAKLYRHWDAAGIQYVHNPTPQEYYAAYGLPEAFDAVVQTGVMVLSPAHHRELLEDTYATYDDRGPGWNYEMRPLSYELLRADKVAWIDPRFNYIWGHYQAVHFPFLIDRPPSADHAALALADVHFLHFTGTVAEMGPAADRLGKVTPPRPRARAEGAPAAGPRELQTPVVLLVHARPKPTREIVELIRAARPPKVLVVGDGPRDGEPDEAARCRETRQVIEAAGWECEVVTNYSDRNLGLKRRIESGLDWAFDLVDEAIVLEDDCHPDPSFFGFCEDLLERYRDDQRVTTISGNNFGPGADGEDASYFFSRYPLIWGWATWSRAWRSYSPSLEGWPQLRDSGWLDGLLSDPQAVQFWTYTFGKTASLGDTWDAAWVFSSWRAGGLTAVPRRNLVTNVGFGEHATNTRADHLGLFSNVPVHPSDVQLRHPAAVERDADADALLEEILFSGSLGRLFERIRRYRPETGAVR